MEHWQYGDIVVLRKTETTTSARMVHAYMGDPAGTADNQPYLVNGQMVTVQAHPYRVIQHTDWVIALFRPEGTPVPRWLIPEQRYILDTQRSRGEQVRLLFPGHNYDVTLFFETADEPPWFLDAFFAGEGMTPGWRERRRSSAKDSAAPKGSPGRFRGWYVNLQSAPVYRPYGFDIVDHALDLVIRPDLTWYWKDEDELQMALRAAAIAPEQAAEIRRAGEEVISLIESRSMPFDDTWPRWHRSEHPGWGAIESFPDGWQTEPPMLPGEGLNPFAVTPH